MRNIFLISKNYFNCMIGTLLGKKKRAKSAAGFAIIFLLVAGLFALVLFQAWTLITSYKLIEAGFAEVVENGVVVQEAIAGVPVMKLILQQGFLMGTFVAIFFAIQKVTGGQRASDADLLLSMPCTRFEIVTAKAIARYFFNLAVLFLLAGPYIVGYLVFYQFSSTVLLGGIVALLFIPFFTVALSYFLDYITTMLFKKAAMGNLLKAGLTLVFLFLFLWLYMSSSMGALDGTMTQDEIIAQVPPIMWMVNIALSFDLVSLLLLAVCTLIPFALGIALFATTFDKQNHVTRRRSVDIGAQSYDGPVIAIFKKELNKFINTPVWIINSILGSLMILGLTIWMVIDNSFIAEIAGLLTPDNTGAGAAFILAIAFSFSAAMSMVSCCSVSLEGKNLWVMKTMPIDSRTVIIGKALLNMVLVTPVIILCSIVLGFVFELTLFQFAVLLICPVLINVFISFGGVFINLIYPKLDWESETAVVKQSMSVMITMLLGMVAAILPIVPIMIPSIGPDIIPYIGWIMLGGYALIAAAGIALALTKGKTLYEKL